MAEELDARELSALVDKLFAAAERAEEGAPGERQRAVDMLAVLRAAAVSTAALGESQAGKRIRVLSKHINKDIADAAAAVVAAW
jgi:hypothetical protein